MHRELGIITRLEAGVETAFQKVTRLGLPTCQLSCWTPSMLTPELAAETRRAAEQSGVTVSAFWTGHSGKVAWNFLTGPATVGLVPAATRAARLEELKGGAAFAEQIGAPAVVTHVGFIPEDPNDPNYPPLLDALRDLASDCQQRGMDFLFETGQETPTTLLRTIEDLGLPNLGINLDPANLIMYGKANPVDALDVFGQFVRGLHAKDGCYPTNGRALGNEAALGEGRVDFPALFAKLADLGYANPVTIEREISGPQQEADVRKAIDLLKQWNR